MTISLSTVLGVGIGLFFVYYVLSLIVSWTTSQIAAWTNLRSWNLEARLKDLLPAEKMSDFLNLKRVQNLQSKQVSLLNFVKGDELVKTIGLEGMSASAFAQAFLEHIKLDQAEGDELIQKVQNALTQAENDKLITETAQLALLGMVKAGVKDVQDVQKAVETLFNETMINVSAVYKQYARRIAVVISLLVTLALNVDTLAIAEHLSKMPSLQQALTAKVATYVEEEPAEDLQAYIAELEALQIPLFWPADALPQDAGSWALKVAGLLITWLAASQGSSFWYQILKRVRTLAAAQPEAKTAAT